MKEVRKVRSQEASRKSASFYSPDLTGVTVAVVVNGKEIRYTKYLRYTLFRGAEGVYEMV